MAQVQLRSDPSAHRNYANDEPKLSNDQVAVLAALATGATAEVVARRQGISTRTVRRYQERIRDRLQVENTMQAAVWAAKRDLI